MKKKVILPMVLCFLMGIPVFSGCAGQTSSQTSSAVSSAEEQPAFSWSENEDGNLTLTAYSGSSEEPEIPAEIDGKPVTEIGESCFAGLLCLKKVHLPEGIVRIGDYAFESCSALEKVYFPSSLKVIGSGAFSGCGHLKLADFQDETEEIGTGAFLYCTSLVSADLPAGLKKMGSFAFFGCSSLAAVSFNGDSLKAIPDRCFGGCPELRHINIPESVVSIGKRAFSQCTGLTNLYIPGELEVLSEYVFEGCESLTGIQFSAARIEKEVFRGCSSLRDLTLSDNTEEILSGAFTGSSLTSLTIPSGIETIEEGAFGLSELRSLELTDSRRYKIRDGSLFTADGKTLIAYFPADPESEEPEQSYRVPDGTEVLGAYAFSRSTLTEVEMPATLKEIHGYCFAESSVTAAEADENVTADPDAFALSAMAAAAEEEQQSETAGTVPQKEESLSGGRNLFNEEDYAGFHEVSNDEFDAWSKQYLAYNEGRVVSDDLMPYIMMYKGEVIPHYIGMTSVQNHDPEMTKNACDLFGDDYEEMYLMMDHGLQTELKRGRMHEDLVLYSGVYDSQLMAAAQTDAVPDQKQLTEAVGTTFTDPIMISTTTDITVACGFSDTIFIIYAPKDAVDQLGAVSIDSVTHSSEKEILMNRNAMYQILDNGVIGVRTEEDGEEKTIYKYYVKVRLLGSGEKEKSEN